LISRTEISLGVTLALFQSSGTFPSYTHLWNIKVSGSAIFCAVSRNNIGCILYGPGDLSGLSFNNDFSTSSLVTVYKFLVLSNVNAISAYFAYKGTAEIVAQHDATPHSCLVKVPSSLVMLETLLLTVFAFLM